MKVSREEIETGALTTENLQFALREMQDSGFVLLEQVLDRAYINQLNAAFQKQFALHIQQPPLKDQIANGRIYVEMSAPFEPPYSDEQLCANPLAVQVMGAAMGEIVCGFYNSNTAITGTEMQQIHIDMKRLLFPGFPVVLPAWSMVVNIPLIDFTEENGSTEVWPGTHLNSDDLNLDARYPSLHSIRMNARVGDLIIRDLRVWHRGMPNQTTAVRTMLAIVYNRPWLKLTRPPIQIPRTSWDNLSTHTQEIFKNNVIID
ncbi:MAG: phytanoyl-CoA dioxygenase family protein [Burkholderiales bacterium]|nr:phytanoyl-CoA dioxygenase family protein [Anaerolineae bacterium]